MKKQEEIKILKENVKQAEGYVEAAMSGLDEIGDSDGKRRAIEIIEELEALSNHIEGAKEK
jgi:hypothetical protein